MSQQSPASPTVFISYAHEPGLREQVKELADWLLEQGVQAITDHPYEHQAPEKGWTAWMQHWVEDADVVLVVCTPRYKALFEMRETPSDGGNGATWESAIITQLLYDAKLHNQRFHPVLPRDGKLDDMPLVLKRYNVGHTLESRAGILSRVRNEVAVPKPRRAFNRYLPGELIGPLDARLYPRNGIFLGRDAKVDEVVGFLTSTHQSGVVYGHVSGCAGIGKTELCKAALKAWLAGGPQTRVFWVQVDDAANAVRLLQNIAEAVGVDQEEQARITTVAQLRRHLPDGLYYLDNLESAAESPGGLRVLDELKTKGGGGIRLLASSRVELLALGKPILVEPLQADAAVRLFLEYWEGARPDADELLKFCTEQLGGHPLAITLMASLYNRHPKLDGLIKEWTARSTEMAKQPNAWGRLDSLQISFDLTREQLAAVPGALELWQFVALFGQQGFDQQTLDQWLDISKQYDAAEALRQHHVLECRLLEPENPQDEQGIHYSSLPPLARYALGATAIQSGTSFDWETACQHAYAYFLQASEHASDTESNEQTLNARSRIAAQMWAIHQLLQADGRSASPQRLQIRLLNSQLRNAYLFNVPASHALLQQMLQFGDNGLAALRLGDLESRLGNVDQARRHYDEATTMFQQERNGLGLANVLMSQGDLLLGLGEAAAAEPYYQQALELYKAEQDPAGQAYVQAELMRCCHRLRSGEGQELSQLMAAALPAAERSGLQSVLQYVLAALHEVCDQDQQRMLAVLERAGFKLGQP